MRRMLVVTTMLLVTSTAVARAGVPLEIAQQGRLLDASDAPMTGTVTLTFTLWDVDVASSANPGTAVWTDTFTNVEVTSGLYAVMLGDEAHGQKPLSDAAFPPGARRWLEVGVNGQTLSPRLAVGSVPFAFTAGGLTCTGCVTNEMLAPGTLTADAISGGAITGDKLADGTITAEKIANGTITSDKLARPLDADTLNGQSAEEIVAAAEAGSTDAKTLGGQTAEQIVATAEAGSTDAKTLGGQTAEQIVATAEGAIPAPGSYIANGTTTQSGASFAIDGSGSIARTLAVGGSVGIGTASPSEKLEVVGSIMAEGTGGGGRVVMKGTSSAGHQYEWYPDSPMAGGLELFDRTTNTDRLVFAPNGNVGIGTDPQSALDVKGDVGATGAILANGAAVAGSARNSGYLFGVDANWHAIPGMTVTLTLARRALVTFGATGDQRYSGPSSCHVGYEHTVDGAAPGWIEQSWGERIEVSDGSEWHHTWALNGAETLGPGVHTIAISARQDQQNCVVCGEGGPSNHTYDGCNLNVVAVYQ